MRFHVGLHTAAAVHRSEGPQEECHSAQRITMCSRATEVCMCPSFDHEVRPTCTFRSRRTSATAGMTPGVGADSRCQRLATPTTVKLCHYRVGAREDTAARLANGARRAASIVTALASRWASAIMKTQQFSKGFVAHAHIHTWVCRDVCMHSCRAVGRALLHLKYSG